MRLRIIKVMRKNMRLRIVSINDAWKICVWELLWCVKNMRLWIVRIMREKLLFLRINYTFKLILGVIGNMHFWLLELTFLNCLYPYRNYALFDIFSVVIFKNGFYCSWPLFQDCGCVGDTLPPSLRRCLDGALPWNVCGPLGGASPAKWMWERHYSIIPITGESGLVL